MGRNLGLEELTLIGLNVGSALKQSFLQMRTLEASFVVVIGGGGGGRFLRAAGTGVHKLF